MLLLTGAAWFVWSIAGSQAGGLPKTDLEFLRQLTADVIDASAVNPGSNGGGRWPLTNTCGFRLITPGKDTYTAFWIRDFSMSADSGLIRPAELLNHLLLVCRAQNGGGELLLSHGLHVPPWAIPDHINYNGRPSFFPGTYASGEDQGNGAFGRLPPIDDHYEFVHIAYVFWKTAKDDQVLKMAVNRVTVFDRLLRAFACPETDPESGLVKTTETDRAVGFGFCDAEVHTGKLLFASLLRYRAARELAEMATSLGHPELAPQFKRIQKSIRTNVSSTFRDPRPIGGWLRASTGLSNQPDVWGTLFALELGLLGHRDEAAARSTVSAAVRAGIITFEGAVRHVPTNFDFSVTSSWERSLSALNSYQNGGYWHTPSGWLIKALWKTDQALARQVFSEMINHLRSQDFRKGPGFGAPWEVWGPNGTERQNAVYLASVALPYGVLQHY